MHAPFMAVGPCQGVARPMLRLPRPSPCVRLSRVKHMQSPSPLPLPPRCSCDNPLAPGQGGPRPLPDTRTLYAPASSIWDLRFHGLYATCLPAEPPAAAQCASFSDPACTAMTSTHLQLSWTVTLVFGDWMKPRQAEFPGGWFVVGADPGSKAASPPPSSPRAPAVPRPPPSPARSRSPRPPPKPS